MHPQREEYWGNVNPIGPRSCYDEGKRCAETLFFDYWRQHQLAIKVIRIFNTYGPRMQPDDGRVVSNFIVQALKGEPITLYGDGQQTRSFCYVDDLVEGMMRLMDSDKAITGPINIGNPVEFTMRELAELVITITGSKSTIVTRPLPQDDPKQRRPDIAQAQAKLGWEPKVALADGLKETIAYFRRTLDFTADLAPTTFLPAMPPDPQHRRRPGALMPRASPPGRPATPDRSRTRHGTQAPPIPPGRRRRAGPRAGRRRVARGRRRAPPCAPRARPRGRAGAQRPLHQRRGRRPEGRAELPHGAGHRRHVRGRRPTSPRRA